MKEVQDYYFKKAKKEGYPARSVYKLEEAQQKYHLLRKGDAVLDLGCQPGSWSLYAAKVIGPSGVVVGVDIQSGTQFTQQSGRAPIHFFLDDAFAEATEERIRGVRDRFQVVLSDMAPRTSGNRWTDQQLSLRLARRVVELARRFLVQGGNFYCKVFEGEDFKDLVEEVRLLFGQVKIVKPKSSRNESREVFLLGLGYKGNEECRMQNEE
ncbi:MAG: RlmE family RNA methyltransferase [Thermodesulfobacteriota bacterium]